MSSDNNVDPVRDMTRRTVTINLDPACEIPAARVVNGLRLVKDTATHNAAKWKVESV